jgi:GTP-binding protein
LLDKVGEPCIFSIRQKSSSSPARAAPARCQLPAREIYRIWRPDGGNGGKGGDIIFEAVAGLNTLIDFRYTQHFKAQRGTPGAGKNRYGAGGADLVIKVPVGTQIISEPMRKDERVAGRFHQVGQRRSPCCAAAMGGAATLSYKTSTNRAPRQHQPGWPGEEMWVWLRLKLLADAGLVGLPNAGKSTFINRSPIPRPRSAPMPSPRCKPQLGVVRHKAANSCWPTFPA